MQFQTQAALIAISTLAVAGCSAEPDKVAPADETEIAAPTPQNPRETTSAPAPTVPERFRGLFALDRKACAEDYNYAPAFQNVTISADRVSFFETGGPVTNVNANDDSVAITLRETVGDGEFTRAIYLAVNPDGSVRYRSGQSQPSKTYVRCAAE